MGNSVSICAAGTGQDYVTGIRVAVDGHKQDADGEKRKDSQNIYMGGVGVQNELTEKFANQQKQAMRRILDQLEQDCDIAEDMKEQGDTVMRLDAGIKQQREKLQGVEERKAVLQEQYGVEPDSQEQKDLELMQKAEQHVKNPFDEQYNLSEEEKEYLANLTPTPYQQEMLLLDKAGKELKGSIADDMRDMTVETASIWATKKALLKVHPMTDAMDEADDIMEAARQELIGGLYDQMKDKLDADAEEQQERIDEEKLEALEEKIRREEMEQEEAKEEANRESMEESVFSSVEVQTTYSGMTIDDLQSDVKSLIQDQTFLDVDLKGLRVDKKL